MGVKISERVKKHHLEWDEVRQDLLLKEYQPTTWNTGTKEYDIDLVGTYKVGGSDFADMYDTTGGTITTISSTGVYYKVNANTNNVHIKGFTHTNGRLTKVGDEYNPIKAEGNISFLGSNNDEIHILFYINGSPIPSSLGTKVISGSGKGDTIPFHCLTDMNDGDYLEVYVANISGARNVTLENMSIILTEMT